MQPYPPAPGLATSLAWRGLPRCVGYGHWVSYGSVARVFGFLVSPLPTLFFAGEGGAVFSFVRLFLAEAREVRVKVRVVLRLPRVELVFG